MKLGQNQSLRSLREGEMSQVSLRERKKARTRAAIREHAMRLFREQGFAETTVDQIAEAADVSPSTFFRYFPNKEAVILQDDYDPRIITAFRAQPPEISTIADLVAERTGRSPDDQAVRVFAGALVGVGMAAMLTWTEDPSADFYSVIDSSMALVEAGLPL